MISTKNFLFGAATVLCGLASLFPISGIAQVQFERIFPANENSENFMDVENGSIAFSDIDGDGDQDVLMTGGFFGSPFYYQMRIELHENDGNGNFTIVDDTPFTGVMYSSIAFADIDGDNDQDVLISGADGTSIGYGELVGNTWLYTNDGNGNFSEVSCPFTNVYGGSITFADIDGDNDQDVFLTGHYITEDNNSASSSELYTNDGSGNFTLIEDTPFPASNYASSVFVDIDSDNDQDLLLGAGSSALYMNDGSGNFTPYEGMPLWGGGGYAFGLSDIDGDDDQDILIIRANYSGTAISSLYKNDGDMNFILVDDNPFMEVINASVTFSDIDGDNDPDVLLTGSLLGDYSPNGITELYTNDGTGNFTLVVDAPFVGVYNSSLAFSDIDGDNDQDLLITGFEYGLSPITELYTNDGAGIFTAVLESTYTGVSNSSIAFADVDGDDDQDVLVTGNGENSSEGISKLYLNNGVGEYAPLEDAPFIGVHNSSIAFSDIDGDNDQDVLITGQIGWSAGIANLYMNDGSGNYSPAEGTPFTGVKNGSIAFSDIDGDDDSDVLITGSGISELYTNDGNGNFTLVSNTPFRGVSKSAIAFSDIDGDNDQDVLIAGEDWPETFSELYTNDGSGIFTLVEGTPFVPNTQGDILFGDIDGDDDQDVLIVGSASPELYTNDGNGVFTLVVGTPFMDASNGSSAFSDIDGDNDLDVLITGSAINAEGYGNIYSNLYINDGNGNFTLVGDSPFLGVREGSISFADIDGDIDLDVLITGDGNTTEHVFALYRNITIPPSNIVGHVEWLSDCGSRNITVELNNQSNPDLNQDYSTSIDENGDFTVPDFDAGIYDILITVDGYLSQLYTDVTMESGTNELEVSGIIAGDLNESNGVNISDFSILNNAFGSSYGDANYNLYSDFNCDGAVTIIDISILNIAFGMVGDSFPEE